MSTKSTVSAPPTTTGPSLWAPWPLEDTPLRRKYSRCQLMIWRTSSGLSSAATSSLTWRQTHSTASSKSKVGRGGALPSRRASRPMTTAAMTKTMSRAATAKTTITAAAGYLWVLDPDALGEEFAVVRGVAEQELAGLGPLEVQVGVVLPREADAAVDLDVLGGRVEVRI